MKIVSHLLAACLCLSLWGCQGDSGSPYSRGGSPDPHDPPMSPPPTQEAPGQRAVPAQIAFELQPVNLKVKLEPLPGVKAPKLTKVVKAKMETTQGPLLIEIYPEAAPNASKRFLELIKLGYFDNTPLFRVEPGFVVQFGINSKKGLVEWKDKKFKDDPSYFKLSPGTLAFAKAGNDTNSTQVFINYGDNSQLVSNGNFTAFAKVVKGFEQTAKFHQDPNAGDQEALWTDTEAFLKTLPKSPDMIKKVSLLP